MLLTGVGDGPWEKMKEFDDALPQRCADVLVPAPFVRSIVLASSLLLACCAWSHCWWCVVLMLHTADAFARLLAAAFLPTAASSADADPRFVPPASTAALRCLHRMLLSHRPCAGLRAPEPYRHPCWHVLPRSAFDNFQFVQMADLARGAGTEEQRSARFALRALMVRKHGSLGALA